MSRTHHTRRGRIFDGNHGSPFHRYRGGSSGISWRRRYTGRSPRELHPAERAAMHEDNYPVGAVRTINGRMVEIPWDYDDSWSNSAESKIPGYWDWRALEASDGQYDHEYDREWYDPYEDSYDGDSWDDRGPEPSDEQWVEFYVDGYRDLPNDWERDYSREYDLSYYEEADDEDEWLTIAYEIANGPRALPTLAEIHADIPRALEREKHRDRRRAARAA